jgi:hypothetical protein
VSEDWKVGYKRALLNEFGRSAYALRTDEGDRYYGGPFDYGTTGLIHEHLRKCEVNVDKSPMPEDVAWNQFMGTFAEDHTRHGLDGVITCRCGHLRKVRVRWEGNFTELLHGILRED